MPKDDAQVRHETRIDRPGRLLLGATAPGGAGVSVREAYALAGRAMRPRSAVALRIEDAAPIEDIFICRRCPVLAFLRTIVDKRVDLVSYFCYVPRPGTPAIMARRVVRRALSLSLSIPTISAAGSRGIGGPQYGCVPQVQQYLNFPTMSFGRV